MTEIENHLIVDRMLLVKVHGMDADEYGSYATVTFYDTSKDEDVDINQVLFDKILEDIASEFKMHVIVIQFVTTFYYCNLLLLFYVYIWWFLRICMVVGGEINRIVRYAHRRVR